MDTSDSGPDGNLGEHREAPSAAAAMKRTTPSRSCVEPPRQAVTEIPARASAVDAPADDAELGLTCDPLDPNGW